MRAEKTDAELLHELAHVAGAAILPHFRTPGVIEDKSAGRFDPVTAADKAAERAMRELLARARPDDAVLGEEFAAAPGSSGRSWILDPIDGTRAFILGLPTWGVLIALADAEGVRHGAMCQPVTGDFFFTDATGRPQLSDRAGTRPIRTRRCARLADALMATTDPRLFDAAVRPGYERLAGTVRMVRFGTDCYAYALLAAGHIDVVVEMDLKPVDLAPFVALVNAAGGALTDFFGRPIGKDFVRAFNGEAVAVGDPRLLPDVLAALRR